MAKLILFFLMLIQLTLANENINNINKKLGNIQNEVNLIQKSLDQNKTSKKELSKQLAETKDIINNVENNIELVNNKKYLLEKKLESLQNQIIINKNQLTNYRNSINHMINNLLIVTIKQNNLLLSEDQTIGNIKNLYLNKLLEKAINKSNNLKMEIIQLESDYNKLYIQINDYYNSLQQLNKNKSVYNLLHQNKFKQYKDINNQIGQNLNKIKELKNKEQVLNNLLDNLLKSTINTNIEQYNNNKNINNIYILPIQSSIKINFGEKQDGVINKGILFKFIEHTNVISIDDGKVVYVGNLNNLGNVVIIQHANNIVSIYCGIIPSIKPGINIKKGQIIATTGSYVYQPLDGIYFELRYKGQPINPFK